MTAARTPQNEPPVLATVECPYCSVVVPNARFCGACGAHLNLEGFAGSQRLHSFAAFPEAPVGRIAVVTTLFPQLSSRAKAPFRLALAVVVAANVALAFGGVSAPLIAVCALGVPLLFLLYLLEVDPYEGSFLAPTALCLLVGAGLGVGWALIGSTYVDEAVLPSLGTGLTGSQSLVAAVVVPALGQLLMCVPLLILWMVMRRGRREPLDGFAAGASGALGFTLAATVTLMAPWFQEGQLVAQPFTNVLAQSVLHGISFPLVSALTTGMVGAAVWATTGGRRTAAKGRWLTSPIVALAVAVLLQIGLGFCDISQLSGADLIIVHVSAIALSILLVRIGIHHVLLHEAAGTEIGPPRVCASCGHRVPAMLFCPHCGVADRAVARAHRAAPLLGGERVGTDEGGGAVVHTAPWPVAPPGPAGATVAFSEAPDAAQAHRPDHRKLMVPLLAGLTVLSFALVFVVVVAEPAPPLPCPPLGCQGPPIHHDNGLQNQSAKFNAAVHTGVLYTNAQGFSVRYPVQSGQPTAAKTASGVTLSYALTSGGQTRLQVVGEPAAGTSAQGLVQSIANQVAPGATPAYQVPGALVGYQPGFGEAFDLQVANTDGSTGTVRLLILAAVRNDFAVAVIADGSLLPDVTPKSDYWNGHPSPASVAVAYFADPVVNSVAFPGQSSP